MHYLNVGVPVAPFLTLFYKHDLSCFPDFISYLYAYDLSVKLWIHISNGQLLLYLDTSYPFQFHSVTQNRNL